MLDETLGNKPHLPDTDWAVQFARVFCLMATTPIRTNKY